MFSQTPPNKAETYTCAVHNCGRIGPPAAMFNTSCNPLTVSMNALLTKVRCRECAERVSSDNGKVLGERGCGVYPLSVTLTQMAAADEDSPPDVRTYDCTADGCTARHEARRMYHAKIGHVPTSLDEVLPTILCITHAEAVAAERGKEPCQPGSGIFNLAYTLRQMDNEAAE